MTARRRLSTRDRAALFTREAGRCHLCGGLVQAGQAWDVSHDIPLACGGADDETNWRVAHRKCHREHTAKVDAPMIAKCRRIEARHIGAKQPAGQLRGRGFSPPAARDRSLTKAVRRRPIYISEDA